MILNVVNHQRPVGRLLFFKSRHGLLQNGRFHLLRLFSDFTLVSRLTSLAKFSNDIKKFYTVLKMTILVGKPLQ